VIRVGQINTESYLSIKIWPLGLPQTAQHFELPLDRTIYVKYKNGKLVPQKGHGTSIKEIKKTKSGLPLVDNVHQDDIEEWRSLSTFNQ
jgi:hypothetical protein